MRATAGTGTLSCLPRVLYIFREWFVDASMTSLARNKVMGVKEAETVQWRGYGLNADADLQKTHGLYVTKTNLLVFWVEFQNQRDKKLHCVRKMCLLNGTTSGYTAVFVCKCIIYLFIYSLWHCSPARDMTSSITKFLAHTPRRAIVGRIPLDEWSARRRDFYLTTDKHPCHRSDSNPRSSGRGITP
jgi:hypothetical protein